MSSTAVVLGVDFTSNVLEHHGVKGMKWGVRRSNKELRNANNSADHEKTRYLMAKKTKELSNDELKAINYRLNQEAQLKKLNPSKVDTGHNVVKKFLAIATTGGALYALSQSPHGKLAVDLGKKLLPTFTSAVPSDSTKYLLANLDRI